MKNGLPKLSAIALGTVASVSAWPQQVASIDFQSGGRAWPLAVDLREGRFAEELVGPMLIPIANAAGLTGEEVFFGSARNGATPEGVQRLETDLFTSKDFYRDRALWTDPRYFRCNSPASLEEQWGANGASLISDDSPASAAWGQCDLDYPREAIVSPYPFKAAAEHYAALLAETRQRGGPTQHTYATVPGEWTGRYELRFSSQNPYWYSMVYNQVPTILSLLTEEYRSRLVQDLYHQGNTNAPQWPAQYCWPEGFMRRWDEYATREWHIMVTPQLVQILAGVARNFITNVHVGREFNLEGSVPRLGADVPRWYGETIGFWDGDTLISWTSNIQGWTAHGAFEFSSAMQTIEIYTPNRDDQGNFVGLNHEAIFYDVGALVDPIRIVRNYQKLSDFDEGDPYVYVECIPMIFPINGTATPVSPGAVIEYEVPDMYGRPWAQIWQKYHEQGIQGAEPEDVFSFE
jgi:hypothetical protein